MKNDKERFFDLIKKDAFFREEITLSSGKKSDYYIDIRRVTLIPEGAYLCARIMMDMLKDESCEAIGGPTLGADPILGAINTLCYLDHHPIKTFIIRKTPKAHGKQQQIEGPSIAQGARVVLIDDVATTGKAFLQSLDVLEKDGIKASKAICVVDRGEGAKEALAERNCELIPIFTAGDFLK